MEVGIRIECGDYIVKSDRYCFWIERKTVTKKGDETSRNLCGYHTTIESLLDAFIEVKTKTSSATTVEKALKDIAKALKEAKELYKVTKNGKQETADIDKGKRRKNQT